MARVHVCEEGVPIQLRVARCNQERILVFPQRVLERLDRFRAFGIFPLDGRLHLVARGIPASLRQEPAAGYLVDTPGNSIPTRL